MVDINTAIEELNTGKIEFDYKSDDCCTTPGEVVILLRHLQSKETPESIHPDGDIHITACSRCGSGEYLHNEDGNQNAFCGQCGQAIDWKENMQEGDPR